MKRLKKMRMPHSATDLISCVEEVTNRLDGVSEEVASDFRAQLDEALGGCQEQIEWIRDQLPEPDDFA